MAGQSISLATRGGQAVEWIYGAALAVFAGLIAYNHFQIVTSPAPLELFEATMLYLTGLYAQGLNPYAFELQPQSMDVYTPLYNIVMAPLTLAFGNTLFIHRLVNAVCIVLSCGLLALSARRMGARWIDCATVAVLTYGALVFYSTPVSSVNALAILLFLAATLVPWLYRWSTPSLVASAVIGILAFYTKQYCVLSLGIVSVYVFLTVSKLRAVIFAIAWVSALAGSLVVAHLTSPYFLANTVFSMVNTTQLINEFGHAIRQLQVFAGIYAGLLLLTAIALILNLRHAGVTWFRTLSPQILPLDAPLVSAGISYSWLCLALTTTAIVISLGQNVGNYMVYLFHLMTPFLLLGLCNTPLLRSKWRALVLALYAFSLFQAYALLPKDFGVTVQGWDRVRSAICASKHPFATGELVWPLVQCAKRVYNDGQAGYFMLAQLPPFLRPADPALQTEQMWRRHMNGLYSNVCARRFDVIALAEPVIRYFSTGVDVDPAYIRLYYEDVEQVPLTFSERPGGGAYVVHIMRPISPPDVDLGACAPRPG